MFQLELASIASRQQQIGPSKQWVQQQQKRTAKDGQASMHRLARPKEIFEFFFNTKIGVRKMSAKVHQQG